MFHPVTAPNPGIKVWKVVQAPPVVLFLYCTSTASLLRSGPSQGGGLCVSILKSKAIVPPHEASMFVVVALLGIAAPWANHKF